ncbi:MAG: nucleotidyltransferase domain-containing protein [Bernardetiaceae bacterium]|nr:nucleotidyltransferase domain-containing protein [Bernardetiaceae bacterium]
MYISDISQKLEKYFEKIPIQRAYIFGSYARKDFHSQSDIDILCVFDQNHNLSFLDFAQICLDLERLLGKKVDCVDSDSLSEHIKPFVERDKILIYEKRT